MQTLPISSGPAWLPASAWPWPTYSLETGTGRIAVTDIGHGPTLLFVHVGTWSFVWRDVIARLQNDFRCVSIDAPGSGLSDRVESAATLTHAAEAVTAVVDALQLNDITLVAHDLGGPAGFHAASRRADRFAALVSVNCFAWRPSGPAFRGMLALMGSAPARASDASSDGFQDSPQPLSASAVTGAEPTWPHSELASIRAARRAWHATSATPAPPTTSTRSFTPGCPRYWPIGLC